MKKFLTILLTGSMFLVGASAFALTMDEAKTNLDKQATEKKLSAQEHSQAAATLRGLVDKGVPVDHAYRVVDAAINQGMKGKDLAEVERSIEAAAPGARKDAAAVAGEAIRSRYTVRETVQMTNTFGKTVAAGSPSGKTSEVMVKGITGGAAAGSIMAATESYGREIRSGASPDKAADNAARTMDRDRTRQQDHDRTRDRDHAGGGSGMSGGGMGMGPGAGMGPGMGSGMGGGPRR